MLSQSLTRRRLLSFLPTVPMAIVAVSVRQFQGTDSYVPKFKIGDYVRHTYVLEEGEVYIQTGRITSVLIYEQEVENQTTKTANYDYVVDSANKCYWIIGKEDSAEESELELIIA